jgi:cardiolipin synthase
MVGIGSRNPGQFKVVLGGSNIERPGKFDRWRCLRIEFSAAMLGLAAPGRVDLIQLWYYGFDGASCRGSCRMSGYLFSPLTIASLHVLVQILLIARVLLRRHREPASRIAWIVVIATAPILGMFAYIMLGEVNIGKRRIARMRKVIARMPMPSDVTASLAEGPLETVPHRIAQLFQVGQSISGFDPVDGNTGHLLADSNATIDAIVADIDAATDHVHLLFYIWLPDGNGLKVANALKRAASRGVTCRAIVDDLGSRIMIGSEHWNAMRAAGVHLARALPIGSPLLRPIKGRIDLRNHRKIVVIDGLITYCGSQNCADPEFRIKAKYAPWVDAMMRFEGPIVAQNQYLFVCDWMAHVDEDLIHLLGKPIASRQGGFVAQVIGTGPTVRSSAMPEMFAALMYLARSELVISTPYYVPNEAMQAAICASARRGVKTTMVFPAVNDSRVVGAASRSYYKDLLESGVHIFEYPLGLLHAKTLTIDGDVTLIGSANMDRRSFDLNYENNILLFDRALTAEMRQRQENYIAASSAVTLDVVDGWARWAQIRNNAVAMLGPVL